MGFSKKIKDEVMLLSARHCCVCHRYKGVKIEVHHILPREQGGKDTLENAIPLCFDCHSDAGHYHAKHPKGTKFSIAELKKHKKRWFEIVKNNDIPQKKDNSIHSRYLITKEFDLIKDISKKDKSNFPISNCIFLENRSFNHFNKIFKNQKYRNLEIENFIQITPEEYTKKHSDLKVFHPDKDEYPFYLHERIPTLKEVALNCKSDGLTQFLLNNKVSPEKISKVFTYKSLGGCSWDGESFIEMYLLRPIYFRFLALTNISGTHIKLKEMVCKSFDGILYQEDAIDNDDLIHFPNMSIEPNQSVIVPLGMFLSDFDDIEKPEDFIRVNQLDGEKSIVLDHVSSENKEVEYLGINYNPINIEYEIDGKKEYQNIHDFDFSNLYWIDGFWNCGSCPHLFFQRSNGDLFYQGELFNSSPDKIHLHKLEITIDTIKVIIAELEHETTIIQEIKINGITKVSNLTLDIGDELVLEVNFGDIIEIKGYYSIFSKMNNTLSTHSKNNLIKKYKKQKNTLMI